MDTKMDKGINVQCTVKGYIMYHVYAVRKKVLRCVQINQMRKAIHVRSGKTHTLSYVRCNVIGRMRFEQHER